MVKGQIEISNRNNIEELNNVAESGMYIVIPNSDTYGTLLVFQAGGGAGELFNSTFTLPGLI